MSFPSPQWLTHVLPLCLLFAGWWCRSLGRHSVNHHLPDLLQHSSYLCACTCSKIPIAPRLTFCSMFAGRGCLRLSSLFRHGHDNVFLDLWEYSWLCACSCAKVPIAPMGTLLTCLPRLTLAQLRTLRSTTGGTFHRDLENFPSPSWETHVWLVVCRVAVSKSREAQS